MKKHVTLGVNGTKCCLLSCLLPFDGLVPEELTTSDFTHDATNWCGCDDIDRTLNLRHLRMTGRTITPPHPLHFCGTDSDMGHYYSWGFVVKTIHELEEVST